MLIGLGILEIEGQQMNIVCILETIWFNGTRFWVELNPIEK